MEFEEFARTETPRLLGLAYALSGNPHDAWDLTQEALVRVGVRWRRVGRQHPAAYARTIVVRLNTDRGRRRGRELLTDATPDRAVPVEVVDELEPWLLTALAALTPQQRAAVVLRVIEDLDHAGIAEHLGCSVGTARSHLSRGLARLRERAPEEV